MSDLQHPPYSPAATYQPRQLNRWLDINAQNGPLGRCQTYIYIPSFGPFTVGWLGYSQVIGIIWYQATNRFSLVSRPGAVYPTLPYNCLVTICCVDPVTGSTDRYKLNPGVGEVLYFECPNYTDQIIEKNFWIEIWDTLSFNQSLVQPQSPNFMTSVLQAIDYRWGSDIPLATPSTVNQEAFALLNNQGKFSLPLQFNNQSQSIPQQTNQSLDDQTRVLQDDQGRILVPA